MTKPRAADLVARLQSQGAAPATAPVPIANGEQPAGLRRSGGGRHRRGRGAGAVRVTVDLDVELHRALRIYALDHGVDASEVLRALLELLDDAGVATLVADRLAVAAPPQAASPRGK